MRTGAAAARPLCGALYNDIRSCLIPCKLAGRPPIGLLHACMRHRCKHDLYGCHSLVREGAAAQPYNNRQHPVIANVS